MSINAQDFDPSSPEQYGNLEKYNSSNNILERLLQALGNFSQTPRASGGEDAYGAAIKREYDRNFMMDIQRNAAVNNAATQFFGINPRNPIVQGAGLLFGEPYGGYGQAMKMLTGSNPMLAASQLYGGLDGAAMGAFGRFGHVGTQEVAKAQSDMLNSAFYNHRTVDDTWRTNLQKSITTQAQTFATSNPIMGSLYGVNANQPFSTNSHLGIGNNDLNAIQVAIKSMQGANGDKDAMQKIANDFVGKIPPTLQAVVSEYQKNNKGVLDASTLQRVAHDVLNNPIASSISQLNNIPGKGTNIFAGVNYGISRGYGEDELNPLFNRAAQLQLLGRKDFSSAINDFHTIAPKALSALRPVASALGTNEVDAANQLFGTEAVDFTSQAGADKIAKLGRDVAAVSRVAGVSIKSLVGMVKTMQDLAAQNPELSYMGSGTAQLVLDATKRATALNAILTPQQSRELGGVQGITNRELSTNTNGLTSNIAKLVGGSLYMARGMGLDKRAQMQEVINRFESSTQNGSDITKFIDESAGVLNINRNNAADILESSSLTSGMISDPVSRAAALKAFKGNIESSVNQTLAGTGVTFKQLSDVYNKGGLNGYTDKNGNFVEGLQGFANHFKGGAGGIAIRDMLTPGTQNNTALLSGLVNNTPEAKAQQDKIDRFAEQSSTDAENFDKSNAGNYATALQNIVNTAMSGHIGNAMDAFNAFRNSMISPATSPQDQAKMSRQYDAFGNFLSKAGAKGGANATDAVGLFNAFGVGGSSFRLKNQGQKEAVMTKLQQLLSSGKSQDQIQREVNADPDLADLVRSNPNLISQSSIDAVMSSPDNFNGLEQSVRGNLTQAQRDAYKATALDQDKKNLLDDLTGVGNENNSAVKYLRQKLSGNSASTLSAIGEKGISGFLAGSDASASDISAVLNNTSDLDDAISAHEKGQMTSKESESDQKDPMSQILDLMKKFMGSGDGSLPGGLQVLASSINSLK